MIRSIWEQRSGFLACSIPGPEPSALSPRTLHRSRWRPCSRWLQMDRFFQPILPACRSTLPTLRAIEILSLARKRGTPLAHCQDHKAGTHKLIKGKTAHRPSVGHGWLSPRQLDCARLLLDRRSVRIWVRNPKMVKRARAPFTSLLQLPSSRRHTQNHRIVVPSGTTGCVTRGIWLPRLRSHATKSKTPTRPSRDTPPQQGGKVMPSGTSSACLPRADPTVRVRQHSMCVRCVRFRKSEASPRELFRDFL